MSTKTKIDWCDSTWNPVTGCLHGCEYCYARRIATRFGSHQQPIFTDLPVLDKPVRCTDTYEYMRIAGISAGRIQPYPFDFTPTFHRYKLDEPQHWKKPRTIFVCSMSDLFGDWVPDEWIQEVFKACRNAPQHRYLFLTKNPKRYNDLAKKGMLPMQHWYGYSATRQDMLWEFKHAEECEVKNLFVSIEPILEPMNPGFCTHVPADWVIIGAETGNRKGMVYPQRGWIADILMECEYSGRPIFMKESLRELMGDDFVQEFPWGEKDE